MGRKLFVGNVPFQAEEPELRALFESAGTVDGVKVMHDASTGRARGFAFVEMSTEAEAARAIEQLDRSEWNGRRLTVSEARPKSSVSPGNDSWSGRERSNSRW